MPVLTLVIALIAAGSTTPESFAREPSRSSITQAKAVSLISQNNELRNTLTQMGYTVEEAAEKFAQLEQAQLSNSAAEDISLGTLAICGKYALELGFGISQSTCSTLFHSYTITTYTRSLVGVKMQLGIQAIYFRTGNRNVTSTYCYNGYDLGYAWGYGVDLTGLKETDCNAFARSCPQLGNEQFQKLADFPPVKNKDYGFAAQVSVDIGINGNLITGINPAYSQMTIEHLASYWK